MENINSAESILTVPPPTPKPRFSFDNNFNTLPNPFPSLEDLTIPYVRQLGVKGSIELLAEYFDCQQFPFNPVQFWFLDVITDCLWRLQDEYQFPKQYQKIILEWVLYFFDLIRDPEKNFSRRCFLKVVSEVMEIADEYVLNNCESLPGPDDIVLLHLREEVLSVSLSMSSRQESSSEIPESEGGPKVGSFLVVENEDEQDFLNFPTIPNPTYKPIQQSHVESEMTPEKQSVHSDDPSAFYQPDMRIPARFLSSSSSSGESLVCIPEPEPEIKSTNEEASIETPTRFTWIPSRIKKKSAGQDSEETFVTIDGSICPSLIDNESITSEQVIHQCEKFLENEHESLEANDRLLLINKCALFAVKQFIQEYFYESFQFKIVKLALMNTHHIICQQVNDDWKVSKVLRDQLKKPKLPKEKVKKEKAPKKDKKKKEKKEKSSKKSSKKSEKKAKPKKEKPKKLTKEEKAEIARLKRLEEEKFRIAEENRRLLFPLKEAADEKFYRSIFGNWSKPAEKSKKKK